jgi:hypothetical protein
MRNRGCGLRGLFPVVDYKNESPFRFLESATAETSDIDPCRKSSLGVEISYARETGVFEPKDDLTSIRRTS